MTSISAISSSNYQSPLQKLQDELQAEINSGTIGSSDQDALSSALTDIDSSLQSSRASDSAGGTRPSPGDLKSKIDDLIAGEVSSGKLTSDQATELQGVFKAAFANGPGGAGGPGGPGGARGHGGPPPTDDASSTDSTSSSSGTSSADDILQQFLQSLQESLSASSSTSYSATGSSSTASDASSSFSALLIDYQT
jgi:flagellar hook-basal body complex protein FliE